MKVIDAINDLENKKREIAEKYCDNCQEWTCEECREMEGDADD